MTDREVMQMVLDEFKSVMLWIDNWSPEFTNDPEWLIDEQKASKAIETLEETLNPPEISYPNISDAQLIEEVRRRGFSIRSGHIIVGHKDYKE